jgi:hypothetical protein
MLHGPLQFRVQPQCCHPDPKIVFWLVLHGMVYH